MSQIQLADRTITGEKQALLSVRDLTVTFEKEQGFLGRETKFTHAVDHVSFELYPSETVSLVGESGSGKTTVARCIAVIQAPTAGSIKYRGEEITGLSGKSLLRYRREVQITFQDPFGSLLPFLDVLTMVSIPIRRLTGERDEARTTEKVRALLNEVGLVPDEVLTKLPHQMSGGERQRVNIARALASEPKVLIADEPVSMLDASQKLNMLLLLKELQKRRNLTILMITHDFATAKIMGGRTAVMYVGKLFEMGPTPEILKAPQHPYTELLLSAVPRLDFTSTRKDISFSTIEKSETLKAGCIFRNRCNYASQICIDKEPPLIERTTGRLVACHNWLNNS